MINILIGIGGTGAKIIESTIFLLSSGLSLASKKNDNSFLFLLVDPDKSNGNITRTKECIENYIDFKEIVNAESQSLLLKTTINYFESGLIWSPLKNPGDKTLDTIFHNTELEEYSDIFNILFTERERKQELDVGFRAHPSIGAAVISDSINEDISPWSDLVTKIKNSITSNECRVMLVGSIFGGTGASGFPVIARYINRVIGNHKNFKLGGILALPYFGFESDKKDEADRIKENSNLIARANEFLYSSKIALQYYESQEFSKIFNKLFILGDSNIKNEKFSVGYSSQINESNLVEVFAAMAVKDFFSKSEKEFDNSKKISLISRNKQDAINWQDFDSDFKKYVSKFIKFSYFYLTIIYPCLNHLMNGKPNLNSVPWIADYFKHIIKNEGVEKEIIIIKSFCEKYLNWLHQIQNHPGYKNSTLPIDLESLKFNINNYQDGLKQSITHFDDLINITMGETVKKQKNLKNDNLKAPDKRQKKLRNIWNEICLKDHRIKNSEIMKGFLNRLYEIS